MGNDQRFPSPPYYVSKECKLIPEAVDKELTRLDTKVEELENLGTPLELARLALSYIDAEEQADSRDDLKGDLQMRVRATRQDLKEQCEAIKEWSAETGGEKAAPDYKAAYDELLGGISTAVEMISEFAEPFDSGGEPEYSHQDVEYNQLRGIIHHLYGTRIAAEEHLGIHPFEANFPRTPQNQTVSDGVEGAHEGTTADKSGSNWGISGNISVLPKSESSLSSPPLDKAGKRAPNPGTCCCEPSSPCKLHGSASPELLPTQLPPDK